MYLETSTGIEPIVIYASDIDLAEQTLYITGNWNPYLHGLIVLIY